MDVQHVSLNCDPVKEPLTEKTSLPHPPVNPIAAARDPAADAFLDEHKAFREDLDEYGAELGPDARFWKTYVREADSWDAELVDGWNKSLDVILIFAALFSAISTALVIESSRGLQEDFTQTTAQSLANMSQILLAMSSDKKSLHVPPIIEVGKDFVPSTSSICVNTLWYLSLSLSITVTLIAMLAKEWCYSFMSSRTGHPYSQARRRQQRWDGLVRWRMQELLVFLPSMIHLALLLFAIGLCIYLWNLHYGVAIPVIFTTIGAVGIYVASTVLPLIDEFCPYGTTISRVYKSFFRSAGPVKNESPRQDLVTSQALHWLIVNCEVPKSVDIALQAIAGAHSSLPQELLKKCSAELLIYQRLATKRLYTGDYASAVSLYSRALSFLRRKTGVSLNNELSLNQGKLEVKIWEMHFRSETRLANGLGDGAFMPTHANLTALRISSTAASSCLKTFSHRRTEDLVAVEVAVSLFLQQLRNEIVLHPAVLHALIDAMGMFFGCGLALHSHAAAARLLMRIVEAYAAANDLVYHTDSFQRIGMILTGFALSRHDYLGRFHSKSLSLMGRVERGLDLIDYYSLAQSTLHNRRQSSLMHFGLLNLLRHTELYQLSDEDHKTLAVAFNRISVHPDGQIYSIPLIPGRTYVHQYVMEGLLSRVWPAPGQEGTMAGEPVAAAYLGALKTSTARFTRDCTPSDETWVFVVETACRASSDETIATCLKLMGRFPFPILSRNLRQVVVRQGLIQLLMRTKNSDNSTISMFARSQLWILLALSTHLYDFIGNGSRPTVQFVAHVLHVSETLELDEATCFKLGRFMGEEFEKAFELWRERGDNQDEQLSNIFYRVYECVLRERNCPTTNPLMQLVMSKLSGIPVELRGLPSPSW